MQQQQKGFFMSLPMQSEMQRQAQTNYHRVESQRNEGLIRGIQGLNVRQVNGMLSKGSKRLSVDVLSLQVPPKKRKDSHNRSNSWPTTISDLSAAHELLTLSNDCSPLQSAVSGFQTPMFTLPPRPAEKVVVQEIAKLEVEKPESKPKKSVPLSPKDLPLKKVSFPKWKPAVKKPSLTEQEKEAVIEYIVYKLEEDLAAVGMSIAELALLTDPENGPMHVKREGSKFFPRKNRTSRFIHCSFTNTYQASFAAAIYRSNFGKGGSIGMPNFCEYYMPRRGACLVSHNYDEEPDYCSEDEVVCQGGSSEPRTETEEKRDNDLLNLVMNAKKNVVINERSLMSTFQ